MEKNIKKEIQEAILAAEKTLEYLTIAEGELKSAKNWGFFDMAGGGFVTTMFKRGKMDHAETALTNARDSMKNLRKELADVDEVVGIDLEIDGFISFADFFFDNVFVDWMVQSKINKALTQVREGIRTLEEVRSELVRIEEEMS